MVRERGTRRILVKRSIAVLAMVVATTVPVAAGATGSLPACAASRLTFALGPTHRYSAIRPFRGGLTSVTYIRVTNDGGTCRFPVPPSVSFDFSPYNASAGFFSATASAGGVGATEILAAGRRANLVAFVRAVSAAQRGYCEPRAALGIALILNQRGVGTARYLFPRRIGAVCSNQVPASSNFGVVWQNHWLL